MTIRITLSMILMLIAATAAKSQETVFALLKGDLKLADKYFEAKDYQSALVLYKNVAKKKRIKGLDLKIARSHHFLKQYNKAVAAYDKHAQNNTLSVPDIFYYAEAQSGISNYGKAVESYEHYLSKVDDPVIMKKVWRLNNIQFLFEDSSHYAVRPIQINTTSGELCAVPYKAGVVFISNRKEIQPIEITDASLHAPFYRIYFSNMVRDTANSDIVHYQSPSIFSKEFNPKFHAGPLAFYDDERKIVFSSTAGKRKHSNGKTLQLYFAENKAGSWKITGAFPYNGDTYSISNPTISKDGTVLYFSSDMKGGFGGKDLYKSEFVNGQWTKPVNLGENINTAFDEVFPYLHHQALYFASDGHPGLGGLDIFKAEQDRTGFLEAQNVGYPLNTNHDDFGIVIDSSDTHGFFTSNRKAGGYNDDIYEFDMDLQSYPLQITGVMKFKEHSWSDTLELKSMPNAKIFVIDNTRNVTVQETVCDGQGNFSIVIPHHSKYKIKVVGEDQEEHIVSLEIPKHRKANDRHEIVIVKDAFKSN